MSFLVKKLHGKCIITGSRDSSHWFSLIKHYISHGFHREALLLYTNHLPSRTHQPILALILKSCASLTLISLGSSLHAESIKFGNANDLLIGTSLISLYSKCGTFVDARKLFDEMPVRNVVAYNAMIRACAMNEDMALASVLFDEISERSVAGTWAAMIEGYAAVGSTANARNLFDRMPAEMKSVVVWTVMVCGYASNGEMDAAKEVFDRMPYRDAFVWSSMVTGYFKKGDVEEARRFFDRIPFPNLVNWNSLIAGYAQIGCSEDSLEAFARMQESGIEPDEFTASTVLSACAQSGALAIGEKVHELVSRRRIKANRFVLNGLVDMYAKCGDLERARAIFEGAKTKNVACWNTMISALASHGRSEEALELFARMEKSENDPDSITFLAVLSACTHRGFVEEGMKIFARMDDYGVEAGLGHYGCLVDLLGRAGRLEEAYGVVKSMPMEPNEAVRGALLGACGASMDVNMASEMAKEVGNGSCSDAEYVMLSNVYRAAEKWEEAEETRRKMAEHNLIKVPGCSSIVVGNIQHQLKCL